MNEEKKQAILIQLEGMAEFIDGLKVSNRVKDHITSMIITAWNNGANSGETDPNSQIRQEVTWQMMGWTKRHLN